MLLFDTTRIISTLLDSVNRHGVDSAFEDDYWVELEAILLGEGTGCTTAEEAEVVDLRYCEMVDMRPVLRRRPVGDRISVYRNLSIPRTFFVPSRDAHFQFLRLRYAAPNVQVPRG